jgi:anti-sigma factor RsiW
VQGDKDHPSDDEIQDALDARLRSQRQAELDAHFGVCADCRATWNALRWAKDQASHAAGLEPPEGLAGRISHALDEEDDRVAAAGTPRARRLFGIRPLWIAAGLAATVLVALVVTRRMPVEIPGSVIRDYVAFRSGELALDLRTADARDLEAYFARAGLPFRARVLDLAMMKYRLVGGKVHRVGGRPSALMVYQREDGHVLLCEMYLGSLSELPAGGQPHEHDGIQFLAYQREALTLAFWPEADVLCVLTGEGGTAVILPLAFGKAMKAQAL